MRQREPRLLAPEHLTALRHLPCLTCGAAAPSEAAHIRMINLDWGQRAGIRTGAGGAEKPADVWALPLCGACHRTGPRAEHRIGTAAFWRSHNMDPHAVAWALWQAHGDVERMAAVILEARYLGRWRLSNEPV